MRKQETLAPLVQRDDSVLSIGEALQNAYEMPQCRQPGTAADFMQGVWKK